MATTLFFSDRQSMTHVSPNVILCSKGKGGEPAFRFQTPGGKKWIIIDSNPNLTHSSMLMVPEGQAKHNWKESLIATTEILQDGTVWRCFLELKRENPVIEIAGISIDRKVLIVTNGFNDKSWPFRTILFVFKSCLFTLTYCTKMGNGKAACKTYLPMPKDINIYIEPPSSD